MFPGAHGAVRTEMLKEPEDGFACTSGSTMERQGDAGHGRRSPDGDGRKHEISIDVCRQGLETHRGMLPQPSSSSSNDGDTVATLTPTLLDPGAPRPSSSSSSWSSVEFPLTDRLPVDASVHDQPTEGAAGGDGAGEEEAVGWAEGRWDDDAGDGVGSGGRGVVVDGPFVAEVDRVLSSKKGPGVKSSTGREKGKRRSNGRKKKGSGLDASRGRWRGRRGRGTS